jgi:hypothetical protein
VRQWGLRQQCDISLWRIQAGCDHQKTNLDEAWPLGTDAALALHRLRKQPLDTGEQLRHVVGDELWLRQAGPGRIRRFPRGAPKWEGGRVVEASIRETQASHPIPRHIFEWGSKMVAIRSLAARYAASTL